MILNEVKLNWPIQNHKLLCLVIIPIRENLELRQLTIILLSDEIKLEQLNLLYRKRTFIIIFLSKFHYTIITLPLFLLEKMIHYIDHRRLFVVFLPGGA